MAQNQMGLGLLISAKDLASPVLGRIGANLGVLGSASRAMASVAKKAFMGVVIAATALFAVFKLAKGFGEFQQGLVAVGAVSRATAPELEMLRDAAIEAGIATQFSPQEAVQGLTELATAGQTAAQATKTLIPVLDLAAGSLGQLGVAGAAKAVVGTLNAYGKSAAEAGAVTDKLLRITQMTNFQTRDFEVGLAKAAAAGGIFNQGLDDVLISMGLLRNRNIDASSSATALRESFRRLGSDKAAQKAVEKYVEVFDKQTGKMRSVLDISTELAEATKDLDAKERQGIITRAFGARGMLAFAAIEKATFTVRRDGVDITLKGAAAIEAMRKSMEGAAGTAKDFKDKLLDTFEGQKTLLKGTLQTLGVVSGEALAGALKPIVSSVTQTLNKLIVAIKDMSPETKAMIGKLVVGVTVFALLASAVVAVTFAFGALVTSLNPVVLALIAIGGVVAGLSSETAWLGKTGAKVWKLIKDVAAGAWKTIKAFLEGFRAGWARAMASAGPAIKAFTKALDDVLITVAAYDNVFSGAEGAGEKFGRSVGQAFEILIGILAITLKVIDGILIALGMFGDEGGLVDSLGDSFDDLNDSMNDVLLTSGKAKEQRDEDVSGWRSLGEVIGGVASITGSFLGGNIRVVSGLLASLLHSFMGVFNIIAGILTDDWAQAWLGAKQTVFGVVKAIMSVLGPLMMAISAMVDAAASLAGIELDTSGVYKRAHERFLESVGEGLGVVETEVRAPDVAHLGRWVPEVAGPELYGAAGPLFAEGPLGAFEAAPTARSLGGAGEDPLAAFYARTGGGGPSAEATGAAMVKAASAAAAAAPPMVTHSTLTVDGNVLGELLTKYQRSKANQENFPVDVEEG